MHRKSLLGKIPTFDESFPTTPELELSKKMVNFLDKEFALETPEGYKKRAHVIQLLDGLLNKMVREIYGRKYMDFSQYGENERLADVYTFGSFKLGVFRASDDIDVLCLCPHYVDREADFFGTFYERLKSYPGVEECVVCFSTVYVFCLL
jgi:poly(A) polymerase Pap1